MKRVWMLLSVTLVGGGVTGLEPGEDRVSTSRPADAKWSKIAPLFSPPAEYAGRMGQYASVLSFYDGAPVKSAKDWPRRRAEILRRWHGLMGAWPKPVARPRMEITETVRVGGYTRHKVRLQVAPERTVRAYLCLPDGKGPFPAVLTVYYEPETAVALKDKANRDFAHQLARRGFVTLSIGWSPRNRGVKIQPLSRLAYCASNARAALAGRADVDGKRIGVMGHSYGGKWAMFASCLDEGFAAAVWSDPGIVFDESRANVNYWEPWYLGYDPARRRRAGIPGKDNPRTGAYAKMIEAGLDLHELHALMAPRPFLVSGGSEDPPPRWEALNASIAVNKLLGVRHRVAMANRPAHGPRPEDNELSYLFFEHALND